jgi:glyoxylate reductase
MKPKILVTRQLPPAAMEPLEKNFEVVCNPRDRALPRKELLLLVRGKEGLLPTISDLIDAEVMDAAGLPLKIIANYGVGYNHIDLEAATLRKIAVTNTPGVLTDTTADLALALLLAVSRRVVEGDAFTRAGKFKEWSPRFFLGTEVHHKTLGLLGFGRIGQAVAKRAVGFDMRILYHNLSGAKPELAGESGAQYVDKETLLKESDFISLHVPLTRETRHIIGLKEFSLMKPTAFIINTARGEMIEEAALVKALQAKKIAGAGLDVYEHEPKIHPDLIRMNNVVVLPHIGSATIETRIRMGLMAAKNLMAAFGGTVPPNCVNPQVFR